MHLIHVETVKDENQLSSARTWLVIADSLFEAMSLIPNDYRPKAAEVRPGAVSGPSRVIGWAMPPTVRIVRSASWLEGKAIEPHGAGNDPTPIVRIGSKARIPSSARGDDRR